MIAATTTPTPVDDQFTSADWGLFLSVAGIWGASFLFIDIGLDALPPGVITLMRVGLGAVALVVLPRQRTRIRPEDRLRLVTLSMVWVAIPFTLFPIAEQHITSAVAGLLNGGTPIFAAIFAMVLLRQPTRGAQLLGIAVGFVGVVFVSLPSIGEGSSETGDASWELGPVVAVAVLGVVGTGIAFALMGTLVGRVGSTRASFITYLIPVVALGLGVTFRDDEVFLLELVGVAFVISGAFLASRPTAVRSARGGSR